jgi:hypothetical protein
MSLMFMNEQEALVADLPSGRPPFYILSWFPPSPPKKIYRLYLLTPILLSILVSTVYSRLWSTPVLDPSRRARLTNLQSGTG